MIASVVLAAGAGRRLGGVAKALLTEDPGNETYLAIIATTCAAAGVASPIVVIGEPHADAVGRHAGELGLDVVVNPHPERGMASSVEVGFLHLLATSSAEAALLWPVDTPFVSRQTVVDITAPAGRDVIVIPTRDGRGGHPVAVGRELWAALSTCGEQKEGARSVFRHNRTRQVRLPVSDSMVLVDIDEPRDLSTRTRS